MHSSPRITIAAAVIGTGALLAACSGSTPASDDSGSEEDTGGTFVVATDSVTGTLDVSAYDGLPHRSVYDVAKASLARYVDSEDAEAGVASPVEVEPYLAEGWEIQDDGIEFTLRDDVVSAYGNPLTPEDVVYTVERAYGTENALALTMLGVAGVDPERRAEVTGEHTVKIYGDVNYTSLFVWESYWLSPLDSVAVEEHVTPDDPHADEWLSTHTAMFGPYYVGDDAGSFTPQEEVRFAKNPNFTVAEADWDEIVIQSVPETAGRISLLQSGQAQMITNVTYENLKVLEEDPNATIQMTTTGSQDTIALNNQIFSDVRVRRAISYALDRDSLAEGVYQGYVKPSTSILSTEIPAANSTADSFTYDPGQARQLLEDAGAVGTEITVYGSASEMSANPDALLPRVEEMLDAAGFDASTQVVASAADFRAGYAEGRYGAWVRAEGPLAADAVYFYNLFYKDGAASNFGEVNLPEINDGVQNAAPILEPGEREAAMSAAIAASNEQQVSVPIAEARTGYVYGAGICPAPENKSYLINAIGASRC